MLQMEQESHFAGMLKIKHPVPEAALTGWQQNSGSKIKNTESRKDNF